RVLVRVYLRGLVVFLDTLTPMFELYVRLRERRQWDSSLVSSVGRICQPICTAGSLFGIAAEVGDAILNALVMLDAIQQSRGGSVQCRGDAVKLLRFDWLGSGGIVSGRRDLVASLRPVATAFGIASERADAIWSRRLALPRQGWLDGHRVTDDKPFLTLVYRGLYIKVV
ncbi:hypothetical protein Taro_056392, partial [Colocasia esculenta]|nr:hypothetical protein [Colocasia esculenta]